MWRFRNLSNHAFKVLAIAGSVFFTGYLLGSSAYIASLEHHIELFADISEVFLSFSIFSIILYTYSKSRDNHSLFLGATFLVIGLLNLFHTLSYPFMPDFITSNSFQKSTILWSISRIVSASLFLASVYIYKDSLPGLINRPVMFTAAFLLSLILLVYVLFYPQPAMYNPDNTPSTARMSLLVITVTTTLYAIYLYAKREAEEKYMIFLIYGFTLLTIGDLVYFYYRISEHLLTSTAFFFMYVALYKSSVELPYERLAVAEEKLRHSAEEKYRNIVDNASDAIITIDLEYRITSWNKAAGRIFGWYAQEVMGKKLPELIVPQALSAEREHIMHEVTSRRTLAGIEITCMRKDGTVIDASLTLSPLRDTDKNISGSSIIFRDVTERKRADEKLRQTLLRLERSNRELEQLAHAAAHELQEPLRMVASYTQLLERRYKNKLDKDADEFIAYAVDGAVRMQKLINDLLAYQQIGMHDKPFELVDCEAVFNKAVANLKAAIEESKALVTHGALPAVMADAQYMVQLFQHLIENAIKFRSKENPRIYIWATQKENEWVFSISDNGIGIAPEYFERIFMIFQRLHDKREYPGTGIGLAICKKIVERHGGRIWVESKAGEGSTFYFTIPAR